MITDNGTGTDAKTETETTYYQGMSDDNNSTVVDLTDSQGSSHDDINQLAGDALETTAYYLSGGPVDHSQISRTGCRRRRRPGPGCAGLPPLTANFTGQVEDWSRQAITDTCPTTWRETETDTSYDATLTQPDRGLPLFTFAHGDLNAPAAAALHVDDVRGRRTPAENLAGLPSESEIDALPCGGSNPTDPQRAGHAGR